MALAIVGCVEKSVVRTAPLAKVAPIPARLVSGSPTKHKGPIPDIDPAEAMRQLRLQALYLSATDLGLVPSSEFPHVYGVLMEWPLGKTTVTVTSFASGDASLYTSSGFGVIGGVTHEKVRAVAKKLTSVADKYYNAATPNNVFPRPTAGKVRFVLLGYKGRRAIEGDIPSYSESGMVYDLFAAGQDVLTQLRMTAEPKGH